MTSAQWVEYNNGTKRKSYNTLPTSNITADAVTVDGFTLSQTDNAGVMTTAGRTLTVTDVAGNVTTTAYDPAHDLPATVTDAQGNTSCYRYDVRGRKVAEWGTGIQPVMFGYNDADRMVTLTTFRAGTETVSTDPSNRTDGDVTTWSYHDASGLESANGVYQPIQWSSEYHDTELGMVYYNYRHYNPMDGRWLGRDKINQKSVFNYCNNNSINVYDAIGLKFNKLNFDTEKIKITKFDSFPIRIHARTKVTKDYIFISTDKKNVRELHYRYNIQYKGAIHQEINILKEEIIGKTNYDFALNHEYKHVKDNINAWNYVAGIVNVVKEGWYSPLNASDTEYIHPNILFHELDLKLLELKLKVNLYLKEC